MSSEIKNTIGLLCKLINLAYKTNLKAEYFRLAKFNKNDENVVQILWNTLQIMLHENATASIQNRFYELNYSRKKFYKLGTENNNGSREILLALVFLISVTLEKDLQEKLENSLCPDILKQSNSLCEIKVHEKFNWTKLGENDLHNYKKWLYGKILTNGNMILEHNQQIHKIQTKYNKCLDVKAHSSLTVYEILAIKNKNIGEQFIQNMEPTIQMLAVHSEWIKKEKQFWKWMGTVLEEERKSS